jgi:hypothetical protein
MNPALGRWMNLDPLAEKYYNKSPFVYTLNNPIYYLDPNGKKVIASDVQSRKNIINMLPKELRKYVQFNRSGKLNTELLLKNQDNS